MRASICLMGNVPYLYAARLIGKLSGLAIDALRILGGVLNMSIIVEVSDADS